MLQAPAHPTAILSGPTASGKTALALRLARELKKQNIPLEIVSCDSLLVYREISIGTAKPTRDELDSTPHHLIDCASLSENYNAGDFVRQAESAIEEIHSRGARAILVGGTGFYLKAFLFGLWEGPGTNESFRQSIESKSTEELARMLEHSDGTWPYPFAVNDRYRIIRQLERGGENAPSSRDRSPRANVGFFWIDDESEKLDARINQRTKTMISDGLIEETKRALAEFSEARALDSVGYREARRYLSGQEPEGRKVKPGLEGLADEISLSTRQLVKKQRTFYRGQFKAHPLVQAREYDFPNEEPRILQDLLNFYGARSIP